MPVCARCGFVSPEDFRYCGSCGAAVAATGPGLEKRKTVTVLFCDVTGSTALGEQLDPETLRKVLASYFKAMREVIERHGGTVEKFIGDAVMAVFGVPTVREDDALRAVRAACAMSERLGPLNTALARDYGTTLQVRMGVDTGEVVTGTEERLATGDTVNIAARLQQAAEPGEILIGEQTRELTDGSVVAVPTKPLELKGKSHPVAAHRLVGMRPYAAVERRLDAPMVGRRTELELLRDAFNVSVRDRSCRLFTIVGQAGVGKTRLTHELLASIDGTTVLRGRCLSYGEGITYWPIVEAITSSSTSVRDAGIDSRAASTIELLLGGGATDSTDEIAWAFRKLVEALAATAPVLVLFDDIHWGEGAFLELVENFAVLSRDAPVFILCLARLDLLDKRPGWDVSMRLGPLPAADAEQFIAQCMGDARVSSAVRDRILSSAGGNPLFVEQMTAVVAASDDADVHVPATIHALLAARIDQLDESERTILACAAVEGEVFHRGAIQALLPQTEAVTSRLAALVRKDLVLPQAAQFPGEDGFRFRHLLIRDAAYTSVPKAVRADLHERFAGWLEGKLAERQPEATAILGYHLEAAYRYRRELGPTGGREAALARRAADLLLSSGRAALARRDVAGSVSLLRRASDLFPSDDGLRAEALLELADALLDAGDLAFTQTVLRDAAAIARACGAERSVALCRLRTVEVEALTKPAYRGEAALSEVQRLIAVFDGLDDERGRAEAWRLAALLQFFLGHASAAEPAFERAAEDARRAGDQRLENDSLMGALGAKTHGPTPVAEAIAYTEQLLERGARDPLLSAFVLHKRALLEAMQGRFETARAFAAECIRVADEFGLKLRRGALAMDTGAVELFADNPGTAEALLREGYELLGTLGETGFRSTVGSYLAEALYRQGRLDEAERVAAECLELAQADDRDPQARSLSVQAKILAVRGAHPEAESLASRAVAVVAPTDYLEGQADALIARASVRSAAGRAGDAASDVRNAIELYELKGDIVSVQRAQRSSRSSPDDQLTETGSTAK